MEKIRNNQALMAEIGRVAEVAGYLWTKGWAERNGGNISVNVTSLMGDDERSLPALGEAIPLQEAMTYLAGNFFYVTGTGKRMRYVAQAPLANGALIRIAVSLPHGNSLKANGYGREQLSDHRLGQVVVEQRHGRRRPSIRHGHAGAGGNGYSPYGGSRGRMAFAVLGKYR